MTTNLEIIERFARYHYCTDIATFKYHLYRPCTNRYAVDKFDAYRERPLVWFMNLDYGNRERFIRMLSVSKAQTAYSWNDQDKKRLDKQYHNLTIETAIELADKNEDIKSFNYILDLNPIDLTRHLELTRNVFKYNYYPFHMDIETETKDESDDSD